MCIPDDPTDDKHQAISILNADKIPIVLDQSHTKILHLP